MFLCKNRCHVLTVLTVHCAHCIGLWPGSPVPLQRDVDIYGFRSQDERVFYLSPWELRTFWYAEALPIMIMIMININIMIIFFVLPYL